MLKLANVYMSYFYEITVHGYSMSSSEILLTEHITQEVKYLHRAVFPERKLGSAQVTPLYASVKLTWTHHGWLLSPDKDI